MPEAKVTITIVMQGKTTTYELPRVFDFTSDVKYDNEMMYGYPAKYRTKAMYPRAMTFSMRPIPNPETGEFGRVTINQSLGGLE